MYKNRIISEYLYMNDEAKIYILFINPHALSCILYKYKRGRAK